jgi:hypothetical protein
MFFVIVLNEVYILQMEQIELYSSGNKNKIRDKYSKIMVK